VWCQCGDQGHTKNNLDLRHVHVKKKNANCKNSSKAAHTEFKLIKIPKFHSSVRKRGSKAGRGGANAPVPSRFSAMSTYRPFSVPLFSALINTFDTEFLQGCPHIVFKFLVRLSQQTSLWFPHTALNDFFLLVEKHNVLCEVRTEFL
jgi:hypothetical protein